MTKKELLEKRGQIYAQITEMRDKFDGKSMSAEERAAWDALIADHKKVQDEIDALEERERKADAIRRIMEQSSEDRGAGNDGKDEERRQMDIFRRFLVNPAEVSKEERDAITGVSGANLLPKLIANQIEVALLASGGMLGVADVIRTSKGEDLGFPTVNDTSSKAQIVAEYNKSSKATPTFNKVTLKAFTYRTPICPISYELLQDSQFNLEALIVNLFSEQFVRGMNDHFTNAAADATTTPRGIVAAANAISAAAAAASPAITSDDLLNLMKGVNAAYWPKAKFMFNQETLVEIMKLKDSQNRYIWNPDMAGGVKATIFGHEYQLNADMPSIAAGKAPVLYGDFSKYKIRIVKDFSFLRLNELLAEYLAVGIFGYCRADGALVDAGTHPVARLQLAGSSSRSGSGSAA